MQSSCERKTLVNMIDRVTTQDTLEVSFAGLSFCHAAFLAHLVLMLSVALLAYIFWGVLSWFFLCSRCTSLASVASKDRLLKGNDGEDDVWSGEAFSLVSADAFGASGTYQLSMHMYAHEQGVVISSAPFGRSCYMILPCHHRRCSIRSSSPITPGEAPNLEINPESHGIHHPPPTFDPHTRHSTRHDWT